MSRAVLLFSGGVDSALALAWALQRGLRVTILEIDHPSRPRGERRAAAAILRRLGLRDRVRVTIPFSLGGAARTPEGYLASRNLLYHAIAQSLAERLGADAVVAGHRSRDAQDFPDASAAFFRRLERLAETGRLPRRPIPILNPVRRMSPARERALVERGRIPLELAWSCWRDGIRPCGRCEKCRERRQRMDRLRPAPRGRTTRP